MATVRRFDRGERIKAEKTPDGFLRAPAFLARTGIYLYVDDKGNVIRELRRPEQVFAPESLASFALAPVTDEHPKEGYVDASNAAKYQRGSIGEVVERDENTNMVRAMMMITDAGLVKKVLDGDAVECSCGYTCDVIAEPGEWNGQPYDTEQTNIRGNHVAIVPAGRAGPAARVKLDAGDAIALPDDEARERARRDDTRTEESPMEKEIVINGQTFKLAAHVVDAINAQRAREQAEAQARVDAAAKCSKDGCGGTMKDGECSKCGKAKNDALAAAQARADAAAAEIKTLKADAETYRSGESKRVADALDVVDVARRAGVEVKLDGALDLAAIRREVAEKVTGVKLDGKSPEYVSAMFDVAKAKVDDAPTGAIALAVVERQDGNGERREDEESAAAARARMEKRNADAWKPAAK